MNALRLITKQEVADSEWVVIGLLATGGLTYEALLDRTAMPEKLMCRVMSGLLARCWVAPVAIDGAPWALTYSLTARGNEVANGR